MKKQTILGVLLLFVMFCFNAKAEVITVEGASEIANAFFTQSARSQKTQLKSATQLEYAWDSNSLTQSGSSMLKSVEEDPTFYVFNNPDGEGFVIVSGDSNTRSIIGYSFEGNISAPDEIPSPMQDYLSCIDAEVKYVRENITSTGNNLKNYNENIAGTPIVEIETAKWGQGAPFNKFCKTYTGVSGAQTGCVPTAFAIVMRHHQWPSHGNGTLTWYYDGDGDEATYDPIEELTDLSARNYDWGNMPLSFSSYTEEQATQVATIMSDLGKAFGVSYSTSNDGTSVSDPGSTQLMNKYFNYSNVTVSSLRYGDDIDSWIQQLKGSLANNNPVPYAAYNSVTGSRHMFVVDGYTDTGYFHFNWGWSGSDNGWYQLTTMTPGGYNYSYGNDTDKQVHRAYINFKPNKQVTVSVNVDPSEAGTITIDGESVASKEVEAGSTVTLQATGDNFYGWLVNGEVVSTENPYSATINSGITYTAKFATSADLYLQAALVSEGGDYELDEVNEPTASTYTITEGVSIELNANTQRGYSFLGWYDAEENLIDSETPTTINITSQIFANPYISAKYSQLSPIQPTVVSSNSDMGSASYSITAGTQELYVGEEITLVATPKSGYMFTGWSDGTSTISTSKTYTVAVEEGKTYTANFALSGADYTVSYNTGTFVETDMSRRSTWTYTTTDTNPVPLQITTTSGTTEVLGMNSTSNRYYASTFDKDGTTGYNTITYTLSVPEGYIITGYEMTYCLGSSSYNGQVTVSNATSTNTPTDTSDQTLVATNLTEQTTSFTVSASQTGQQYIGFSSFIVSVLSTGGSEGGGEVTPTKYTITVSASPAEGGTATVAVGTGEASSSVTVDAETNVTITATPAEGYEFVNWTNGGSILSTNTTETYPISANITLTANFRQTEQGGGEEEVATKLDRTGWTVTASSEEASGEGAGNGVPSCIVDESSSTYWHSKWYDGEATYPHWFKIDMKSVKSIEAFDYVSRGNTTADEGPNNGNILNYKLYVSDKDIDVNSLPDPVKTGTFEYASSGSITSKTHNVELETPVVGRYIMLYATGNSANNRQNASCVDFQVYGKPAYTVSATASPTEGGSASVSANVIGSGESVTFTASPNTGYNFLGWYNGENKVSESLEYTATVTSDLSLTAKFAKQTFTVSATPEGTNGTASVSPNGTVEYGTQVTFTATANPGYRFTGWYQNGELVTMANPYTIQSVTGNIDYVANFVESSDELLLTFACLSDLHAQQDLITDANNIQLRESVTKTLNQIKSQENVDLIVLGGDYTSNNAIPQTSWETTRELLVNATRGAFNGTKTPVIYVNGNHDYEVANYDYPPRDYNAGEYYGTPMKTDIGALAAEDCFYETADNGTNGTAFSLLAAYHYVVNGFDFVVLNAGKNLFTSASDYSYSTESVEWCKTKLAEIYATDKNKTVFFLVHIPFSDSNSLNSGKGMASNTATTLLKTTLAQYPNLIMLYGHDHGGDTAYIRTATEQRVTEYATNGDVYTGEGSASSLYYIQNYNTNKYLGYNSYNLATTDTQSSDVTITTSTVTDGAFVFDLSTTLTNNTGNAIRYLHCGSSGRFSGNNENGATNQQIKVFKVEDPSAATLTATQVTEITSGGTYMLVASNDGTNYYALTNEITYNTQNDNSTQRMVGAAVTITDGTITYAPGTASVLWNIVLKPSATDKSFFSSFMGSMRYYANTIEGDDQLSERKIVQALMVYVYADRVELKMKNYGQSGTINGVTVNQDLTPYISYRTVTHSDYAVTAAPTITSTGDDVNAETEVTVTVDAPEWHNLYYTINGDTPTEASTKVDNGQITFTATEGEYVVKVVAQEGIRLVSPVAEVTYRVVDTHGITVSATEGGTADFSINEEEGTVTLTATEPTEGYYFVGWSVGESAEIVSEDLTYTISIVENAAYKANYAKRTYTVTVRTNNEEWGTVNTIANPVTHGETVTLTAEPKDGYRFVNWTVSGNQVSTDAEYTTDAITADVEYIANFEEIPQIQYYSVVAIAGTGGSATASSSSVEENTTVTLTATPESGYTFRNWTVAGEEVSTENPYAPTITANTKYVAHFVPENANTLPTGYCTISSLVPSWGHITSHSLVSFGVNVGGAVQLASENVPSSAFNDLTGSKSVTAKQGDQLVITFVNGTYSNNVWAGFDWDRDGDWDDVVAEYSEPGRTGGSNDEGSITITIPDDAKLGKSRLRILSDGDVSGDANVPFDKSSPMCGTYGAGKIGYAGSYYDITLYVEEGYVSDVTYNVTVSSADENMGIASASASVVSEKRSVTLTAEPKDGYRFVNWTNEGNEVSTDNPYTIQSVTDNINYVANFEKLPTYTVTARSNNDAMGVVTPSSSQVIYGNTATIKAVAKPNYRFVNWTKGTDVVSTSATFTTPIITANAEYIANFEAMPTEAEKISIVDASTNFATYQSYVIGNIKDENYSTLFWSEGAQEIDKYVMVDLGALYNVEDIKFYFDSGDKPYGAVVEISTDNSTWTEVSTFVTTDLGADNTYVCDAEKKTAQYIRMRINVAGSNWLKLKEFEVYGLKTTTSSADITKTTATEDATVEVTTDAPATIKVGTETYTTTAENLTATITLNVTSAETVTIESIGANITSIDCGENAVPTELPTTITEVELRNVNAGEVEIEAPLLEKITVVSDAEDNVATVAVTSDLSQGVQVVVEKEIKTSQPVEGKGTPTYFNFLSMPFAFNTADIKYWDEDSWETAEPENHIRILLYNLEERAKGNYNSTWRTLQATESETIAANQGFVIVGSNAIGNEGAGYKMKLQFTSAAEAYTQNGNTKSVATTANDNNGNSHEYDKNWNIVGVPYLTSATNPATTIYTNNGYSYDYTVPAEDCEIKPYQAFMLQTTETLEFTPATTAALNITKASEGVYARAYISVDESSPAKIILSDESSENFVVNEDAWYTAPTSNAVSANYFIVDGCQAGATVQPAANELPMNVYTGAGTSHRISLTATDGNYNVYLKDAATDETVCLNDEDYTFTATAKTTIADRFTVSMLEPTGIIDAARAEGTIKPVVLSNAIKLYGTEEGDQVSLYTANGIMITNAVAQEGVTTIPTSVTGVIIIKVAGETIKVVK